MNYILLFLTSVFLSSVSQVILKVSANRQHKNALFEYLNIEVVFAYVLFLIASFITVLAYRVIPLSMGAVLESCGYIFVTILSIIILKENIEMKKICGLLLIMFGICVFYL